MGRTLHEVFRIREVRDHRTGGTVVALNPPDTGSNRDPEIDVLRLVQPIPGGRDRSSGGWQAETAAEPVRALIGRPPVILPPPPPTNGASERPPGAARRPDERPPPPATRATVAARHRRAFEMARRAGLLLVASRKWRVAIGGRGHARRRRHRRHGRGH